MPTKISPKLFFLRTAIVICGCVFATALLLAVWGMVRGNNVHVSSTVIATVVSPNGQVLAILTRTDAGPKMDYGYLIDLKSSAPGAQPIRVASIYAAQKNKSEPGMKMVWRDDHTLELQYYIARMANVSEPDETIGGQKVTTVLMPVVSAAPAI